MSRQTDQPSTSPSTLALIPERQGRSGSLPSTHLNILKPTFHPRPFPLIQSMKLSLNSLFAQLDDGFSFGGGMG